jgi:hypothetical protein
MRPPAHRTDDQVQVLSTGQLLVDARSVCPARQLAGYTGPLDRASAM